MKSFPQIIILQHPQEPRELRGSADLVLTELPQTKIITGLSWPSLSRVVEKAGLAQVLPKPDPKKWLSFFVQGKIPTPPNSDSIFTIKNSKLSPLSSELLGSLEGMIFLDGTWSQAKTLWWRNAWLLKTHRAVLIADQPSLYGKLRKEPRPECLSTVESVGLAARALTGDAEIQKRLLERFASFLDGLKASR